MNREYRLNFCKVCENRKMNMNRGLICGLTNELADFNENCNNFVGDEIEVKKLIQQKEIEKRMMDELERSGNIANSPVWLIIRIIGLILFVVLAIARMMR